MSSGSGSILHGFRRGMYLNFSLGIILTAAIVLVYTILGGFMAVSLTDVLQGFVMLAALIGLLVYSVIHMEGWNEIKNKGRDHFESRP